MKEYRIVKNKGIRVCYKVQRKTSFWIFNWWRTLYNQLSLEEAQAEIKWHKNNPVAKKDTVIETFKF